MNRILLLMDHRANRRVLAAWLAAQYELLPADADAALDEPFDLLLLDGGALDRLRGRLEARRRAEEPCLLPCLLVTRREDVGLATRDLWRAVDDLVLSPVEKVELQARVEILLRARRLSWQLRLRMAELEEVDRCKDEFLATLGHELRNPLAPLRNGLQILRVAADDAATVGQVQAMMDRQVRQIARLVDDLLDVARIARGKVELRKEPVDLRAVVDSAVESCRPLVEASDHELALAVPPAPLMVEGDPARLAQVVANLLNNAAKYTERGAASR